jgi:hypothetical protein
MRVVGEHRLVKAKEQINQSIQDNRKIKTDEIQYQMNVSHKRQRWKKKNIYSARLRKKHWRSDQAHSNKDDNVQRWDVPVLN